MANSRVCSVQFAEPHVVAPGLPLCERLGSTAELETHSPPGDCPHSDTNRKFGVGGTGFSTKLHSGLFVYWKDSQNFIESCYSHSDGLLLQGVRSARRRNAYRAESRNVPNMKLPALLSWQLCYSPMHEILSTREVHPSLGVHIGAPLPGHDWLSIHMYGLSFLSATPPCERTPKVLP